MYPELVITWLKGTIEIAMSDKLLRTPPQSQTNMWHHQMVGTKESHHGDDANTYLPEPNIAGANGRLPLYYPNSQRQLMLPMQSLPNIEPCCLDAYLDNGFYTRPTSISIGEIRALIKTTRVWTPDPFWRRRGFE